MTAPLKHYSGEIGPGDIIAERIPTLCGLTQPHVEDFAGTGAATCADCVEIDRQLEAERKERRGLDE